MSDGYEVIVDVLLGKGADTEAEDSKKQNRTSVEGHAYSCRDMDIGCTPLHVAAKKGHVAIVKALLDKGANKEVEDGRSWNTTSM